MTEAKRPICCQKPMSKSGYAWSGLTQYQRYKCNTCGKTLTPTQGEFMVKKPGQEKTK